MEAAGIQDKVGYLLRDRDSDPNLAVLRNYFQQIKTSPHTLQTLDSVIAGSQTTNGKEHNEDNHEGLGHLVSPKANDKKRSKHRSSKKRQQRRRRRKIFLTVNEAFSTSDYGREMRDLDMNYIVYVPVTKEEIKAPESTEKEKV